MDGSNHFYRAMENKNLINQEFGLLVVIGRREVGCLLLKDDWLCRCRCEARIVVAGEKLRSGEARSCGQCYRRDGGSRPSQWRPSA